MSGESRPVPWEVVRADLEDALRPSLDVTLDVNAIYASPLAG